MNLPRILVIDDQIAADRQFTEDFLSDTNSIQAQQSKGHKGGTPTAAITFCRGQSVQRGYVSNDPSLIHKEVAAGQTEGEGWSLVLLDVMFVSGDLDGNTPRGQEGDGHFGEEIRDSLLRDFPDLPLVMLTTKHQSELQDGSTPYLSKADLNSNRLRSTLLRYGRLDQFQSAQLLGLDENTVIASAVMRSVLCQAFECAQQDMSILLLGETGVGKEVVARFIHQQSSRHKGPFEGISATAIPDTLIESELFGTVKGGAHGAIDRAGVFERAAGGTVLLDEIGDMSYAAQTKVLRTLEEKCIYRVGGTRPISVDYRLISATSKDIPNELGGQFREDLYHRINTAELTIPPLRERKDDIGPLTAYWLDYYGRQQNKPGIIFSKEGQALLHEYRFPGNVRELRNIIERLVATKGSQSVISVEDVRPLLRPSKRRRALPNVGRGEAHPTGGAPIEETERGQPIDLHSVLRAAASIRRDAFSTDPKLLSDLRSDFYSAVANLLLRYLEAGLYANLKPPKREDVDITNTARTLFDGADDIKNPSAKSKLATLMLLDLHEETVIGALRESDLLAQLAIEIAKGRSVPMKTALSKLVNDPKQARRLEQFGWVDHSVTEAEEG